MSTATIGGVPRGPLIAAGLAIGLSLALAIAGRMESSAPLRHSRVIAQRALVFADGPGSSVIVTNAANHQVIERIAAGEDNFLRVTMHTLATARAHSGIGETPPFTLTSYADGRLELTDPATGRRIDLQAFGPTNEANFMPLLTTKEAGR
jgi:putative photosynthetic complex assembly protein